MKEQRKVPPPIVIPEGVSLRQAQERVVALEQLFRHHGIPIEPGKPLEAIALSVFDALYQRETPTPNNAADVRVAFKHLIGLNELAGMTLAVKDHPEFHKLIPHLRLLNEGVGIQNMPSPVRDQATNKVFELFAALLALHCGKNLEMDDDAAAGRNPDVLFEVDGRTWGIACKALHGPSPEGFIGHLEKGIDQIEKSPAERGFVLFTIKNLIDQDKYWSIRNLDEVAQGAEPLFSAFADPERPFYLLAEDAAMVSKSLTSYLPQGYLESAFAGKKSLPGFMVWAHVTTAVVFKNLPVPTSARVMAWQHVGDTSPSDMAVLRCLHEAAYASDQRDFTTGAP